MDFETLVRTRKSVRGYTSDPVSRQTIDEIVELAKIAPSSMNTQPWHIHVLTGAPLEEVRRRNTEMMAAGAKPNRDIHTHGAYEGVHRERQVESQRSCLRRWVLRAKTKPCVRIGSCAASASSTHRSPSF